MLTPEECLRLVEKLGGHSHSICTPNSSSNNSKDSTAQGSPWESVTADDFRRITQYLADLDGVLKKAISEQKLGKAFDGTFPLPPYTGKILSGILTSRTPSPQQLLPPDTETARKEMVHVFFRVCATLTQVPALRGWACLVLSEVTRPIRQARRVFQDDPVGASFVDGFLLLQEPPLKRLQMLLPPSASAPAPPPPGSVSAHDQQKEEQTLQEKEQRQKQQQQQQPNEGLSFQSPYMCDEDPEEQLAAALVPAESVSGQRIYEHTVRAIVQGTLRGPDDSRALAQVAARLAETPALWAQFLESARRCCLEAAPALACQLSPLLVAARVLTAAVRRHFAEAGRPGAFCGLFGPRLRTLVGLLAAMPRFCVRDVCAPSLRAKWLRDVERVWTECLAAPGRHTPELWFVVVALFGAWASFAFNALRYFVCAAAPVPHFLSQFVAWTLVPPLQPGGGGDGGDRALLRTELAAFLTSCTLDPCLILRMEFLPAPFRRYWALVDTSCRCALLTAKGAQAEEGELPPGCADPVFIGFEVSPPSDFCCCENHKVFAMTLLMSV